MVWNERGGGCFNLRGGMRWDDLDIISTHVKVEVALVQCTPPLLSDKKWLWYFVTEVLQCHNLFIILVQMLKQQILGRQIFGHFSGSKVEQLVTFLSNWGLPNLYFISIYKYVMWWNIYLIEFRKNLCKSTSRGGWKIQLPISEDGDEKLYSVYENIHCVRAAATSLLC